MKKQRTRHKLPTGKCPLCLLDNRLLDHSHIIPEFAYEPFYDEKHRLRTFEGDGSTMDRRFLQKGIREYLLCGTRKGTQNGCEGKLSVWEGYAKNVIGPGAIAPESISSSSHVDLKIDYKLLKLYGMSLLWRLSVSKRPEFGIGSIGARQEALRHALNTEDPLMPDEFPFFIQAFLAPDGNFYDDWMYSPMRYDFHGSSAISMVIGGMLYTFTVGMPADLPTELAAARPTLTGQLSIPVLPIHNFPEFEQVYIKQVQASKRHAQLRDKALTKEAPSFVALFE